MRNSVMDVAPDSAKYPAPDLEWRRRIEEKASGLSALQAPLEAMFLGIGKQLHDLARSLRMLDEQATTLTDLIEAPDFSQTLKGLEEAMEKIGDSGTLKGKGQGARLQDLISRVRESHRTLGEAASIMGYVRILGINATIEGAHLGDGAIGLRSFTEGILTLSEKGRGTLDRALTVLTGLEKTAMGAAQQWRDFEGAHSRQVADIKRYFSVSLSLFHDRKKAIAQAMDRLRDLLNEGSVLTGRLVGDLQFGDILRQRIEHVVEGLEAPFASASGATNLNDVMAEYAAMCDLQAVHMDDILKDYGEKTGHALRSLEALADIVAEILTVLGTVYRHAFGSGGSFLSAITDDLAAVFDITAAHAVMLEKTRVQLRDVVHGTAHVTTDIADIRDIDIDMNVLGLNAAIICGNRGWDGRTLTVLAHELRACAATSRQLTDRASAGIDRIVTHAGELVDGGARDGIDAISSGPASDDGLAGNIEGWIGVLNETDRNISQTLRLIEDVGADAMQGARTVVGRFRDNEDVQKTLMAIGDDLRCAAAQMAPHLTSDDLAQLRRTSFHFMEARYTMESERQLHSGQGRSDREPAMPVAGTGEDTFLDDVFF